MRYDNLHSAVVAWAKVLLPLIALAILSTLFLVARTVDPEGAIPFAEVDIDERIREPRLTLPTWAGVTSDGSALTVRAAEARPGRDQQGARATEVVARLDTAGGGRADIRAAEARLDPEAKAMTLGGGVQIDTSTGWRVQAADLTATMDRTSLTSAGAVTAAGPAGQVEAGALAMTEDARRPGTYLLVFDKGVSLIYDPPP